MAAILDFEAILDFAAILNFEIIQIYMHYKNHCIDRMRVRILLSRNMFIQIVIQIRLANSE